MQYLPPVNEVCEGYVFTGVCPHCMLGYTLLGRHTPPGRHPPNRHTHPRQTDTPQADTPQADTPQADTPQADPPCTVHAGIWSKSGQYISHWNAFLFDLHSHEVLNLPFKIIGMVFP